MYEFPGLIAEPDQGLEIRTVWPQSGALEYYSPRERNSGSGAGHPVKSIGGGTARMLALLGDAQERENFRLG